MTDSVFDTFRYDPTLEALWEQPASADPVVTLRASAVVPTTPDQVGADAWARVWTLLHKERDYPVARPSIG